MKFSFMVCFLNLLMATADAQPVGDCRWLARQIEQATHGHVKVLNERLVKGASLSIGSIRLLEQALRSATKRYNFSAATGPQVGAAVVREMARELAYQKALRLKQEDTGSSVGKVLFFVSPADQDDAQVQFCKLARVNWIAPQIASRICGASLQANL